MLPALTQNLKRSVIIIISVILLTVLLHQSGTLQRLEWISYDWRINYERQESTAPDELAIVLIDDASLRALNPIVGRWPWPRSIYADVLDFFSMGGAKSVLFDVTFTETAVNEEGSNANGLNIHDEALVTATSQYPFTYHAARLLLDRADERNSSLLDRPLPEKFVQRFSVSGRFGGNMPGFVSGLTIPSNNNYYIPFKQLSNVSPNVGIVEFNADDDGIYRRTRLLHRYQDAFFPALSITSLLDDTPPGYIRQRDQNLDFSSFSVPLDAEGLYLVNPYKHFNTFSISGILASLQKIRQGELDDLLISPYEFENKTVFIGASAAGLQDLKSTPIDGRLPGVMLHASIAGNVLQKDFLRPAPGWVSIFLVIIFAAFTTLVVLGTKNMFVQNAIPLFMGGGFSIFGILQFQNNLVIEMIPPLLSIALSWAGSFSSLVLIEGREKRKFKRMMSQYLSPAVLQTVVSNQEEFAKAEVGSKENITILFSDIRGFTNMSEKMQPEDVVKILNHYFSDMTDAIFSHQGTIDKFIGDAIMAFWGAPIKSDDHADNATLAALNMIEKLRDVKLWLKSNDYPDLNIGIGLHTGDAILGNIGSESKLDYTIIGDNVNLASRMEGLTKPYGCQILITESTRESFSLDIPCRVIDMVRVKGKELPIRIFQPLLNPQVASAIEYEKANQVQDLAEKTFNLYLAKQWQEAIDALAQLPSDEPTDILRQRCEYFLANPPASDWDGVYTMTSK